MTAYVGTCPRCGRQTSVELPETVERLPERPLCGPCRAAAPGGAGPVKLIREVGPGARRPDLRSPEERLTDLEGERARLAGFPDVESFRRAHKEPEPVRPKCAEGHAKPILGCLDCAYLDGRLAAGPLDPSRMSPPQGPAGRMAHCPDHTYHVPTCVACALKYRADIERRFPEIEIGGDGTVVLDKTADEARRVAAGRAAVRRYMAEPSNANLRAVEELKDPGTADLAQAGAEVRKLLDAKGVDLAELGEKLAAGRITLDQAREAVGLGPVADAIPPKPVPPPNLVERLPTWSAVGSGVLVFVAFAGVVLGVVRWGPAPVFAGFAAGVILACGFVVQGFARAAMLDRGGRKIEPSEPWPGPPGGTRP